MTGRHLLRYEDKEAFKQECRKNQLDHIEELDLHISQAWAVGDRASSADSPYEKKILASTNSNIVERTQDPPLGTGNKLPGDSLIMIYAMAGVVRLGNYSTSANKKDTQNDLDRSVIQCTLGGARIFEVYGPTFMDYGPTMLAGSDGSNGAGASVAGFQPTAPRNFRPLACPRALGTEQTWTLSHLVARTSDWGAAFTADYTFLALLGRKR
jgi:hypothetical protein